MNNAFLESLRLLQTQEHVIEPEYRLYYDIETGEPRFYTMEELPGEYINVDAKTYSIGDYNIRIVDRQIHSLNDSVRAYTKLVPSDTGQACHKDNVMIIDQSSSNKWILKKYTSE